MQVNATNAVSILDNAQASRMGHTTLEPGDLAQRSKSTPMRTVLDSGIESQSAGSNEMGKSPSLLHSGHLVCVH